MSFLESQKKENFNNTLETAGDAVCYYAKFRAIIAIIGSFIACLFLMFFGITTLLSKTPEPSPTPTDDEDSSKKNKPAPKWLSVVFIILGPLIVGASFLVLYLFTKYPRLCTLFGVLDGLKTLKRSV